MMRSLRFLLTISVLTVLLLGVPASALAQDGGPFGGFFISTPYPVQVIGIGETLTLNMTVRSPSSQIVALEVADLPAGWSAEFRGGGREIHAIFVPQDEPAKVDLRITPSQDVAPGTYRFQAVARASGATAEFPLELIVKEKVPPSLSFEIEYPTVRGGSESAYNFSATLKNAGDDDVTVTLNADAPKEFSVTFKSSGKDITNLPTDIKAGSSQRIDITATPLTSLSVGTYPMLVTAQGENVEASLNLMAEVVGQPQLTLTTPDGRLSGSAYLGRSNPIKLVLRNTGNAPAVGVQITASSPAGWTVTLDPEQVVEVPADGEMEVTANIKPADKAIAGDYMITFRAQPTDSASKSVDFRVTVRASTLWGVVGVALIAVAVGIVGLAVVRFGRR
ncbi:MAG: NEW3 domain-containing protein [Anaerolineales bacterium]